MLTRERAVVDTEEGDSLVPRTTQEASYKAECEMLLTCLYEASDDLIRLG